MLFCPTEPHKHDHDTAACEEGGDAKEGAALSSADHGHSHGHKEHAHEGQEYDPDCAACNDEGHAHGHVRKTGKRVIQSVCKTDSAKVYVMNTRCCACALAPQVVPVAPGYLPRYIFQGAVVSRLKSTFLDDKCVMPQQNV